MDLDTQSRISGDPANVRIVFHNIGVMLGIALPVLLSSAMPAACLLQKRVGAGTEEDGHMLSSLAEVLSWFVYGYVIWALPAIGICLLHQVLVAILQRLWPTRRIRLGMAASSLGIAASLIVYDGLVEKGDVTTLAVVLLPAAIAYGLVARPLAVAAY